MSAMARAGQGCSRLLSLWLLLGLAAPLAAETVEEYLGKASAPRSDAEQTASESFRGQFRSVNYAVLSAGIPAQVTVFSVRTGSRVKKGQTLAEFDCDLARVDHRIGLAKEAAATKNLEVNQRLNDLENIGELDLSLSIAELSIAKSEVERTAAILDECVITAPFSGTVTQKFAQAFEYVNLGDPLVELVDTENLEIEMVLPSIYLNNYKKGTTFFLEVDETGQRVSARVARVVDVIDPVSQTLRVIGVLAEPAQNLMPGMSGVVVFAPQ